MTKVSTPNFGILLLLEDNPSSLGDWYLTRVLSYALAERMEVFLVKNLSQSALTPNTPILSWLEAFLGANRIISVRFSDPHWCSEVEREVFTRTGDAHNASGIFVSTVFEDYTQAALEIAEHMNAEAIAVKRPLDDRNWSIRDKAAMRSRWRYSPTNGQQEAFAIEAYSFETCQEALDGGQELLTRCEQGIVVKPRGMAASAGVTRIVDPRDLKDVIARVFQVDFVEQLKISGVAPDGIVIEEFVEGPEYSIEAVVIDGRADVLAVVEKRTKVIGSVPFAEVAHIIPARVVPEIFEQMKMLTQFAVDKLGIWRSVIHLEAIVSKEGVRPVEVGVRPAGDRIPLLLYRHSGLDLIDIHARLNLGLVPNWSGAILPSTSEKRFSALIFAASKDGLSSLRDNGWPVISAEGDCVGRWGCIHATNVSSDELDLLIEQACGSE